MLPATRSGQPVASYSEGGRHGKVALVRCVSVMAHRRGAAWSWMEEKKKQDAPLYFVHDSRHTHRPNPDSGVCRRTWLPDAHHIPGLRLGSFCTVCLPWCACQRAPCPPGPQGARRLRPLHLKRTVTGLHGFGGRQGQDLPPRGGGLAAARCTQRDGRPRCERRSPGVRLRLH